MIKTTVGFATPTEVEEVRKYHATSQYADPRVVALCDQLLALLKP